MTDDDTTCFELKDRGDFVRVELIAWSYPGAEFSWDRNWIRSKVAIKAGGFSGQFDCELAATDFDGFKKELSVLYNKLDGTASFNTLEGQLEIKIKGDGNGHLKAECSAMDLAGMGNELMFTIDFDQTAIPRMIKQLEKIMETFPVPGDLN